jgi:hypothetical protein
MQTDLGVEEVCYGITRLSINGLGIECKVTIISNLDLEGCSCSRGDNARDDEQKGRKPSHIYEATQIKYKQRREVRKQRGEGSWEVI